MASEPTDKQLRAWLWMPLIIGLILGTAAAAMTGQWWWSTVGVLVGATLGWVGAGRPRVTGWNTPDK